MIDKIIRSIFEKEKRETSPECPDPEVLAAYIDNRLSGKEKEHVERHLIVCDLCLEGIILNKMMEKKHDVCQTSQEVVDVVVRFLNHAVNVVRKCKDVKVLPEPKPVPLRGKKDVSMNIARFSREFDDFSAEVEIERHNDSIGDIRITIVKDEHPLDDVRVTLLKDDKELVSYLTEGGRVVFEDVHFDNYEIIFAQQLVFKGRLLIKVKNG